MPHFIKPSQMALKDTKRQTGAQHGQGFPQGHGISYLRVCSDRIIQSSKQGKRVYSGSRLTGEKVTTVVKAEAEALRQ